MRLRTLILAACAFAGATSAQAEPLAIARNAKVMSADDRAIGLVNRVVMTADNNVSAIRLILGSRMVTLPADQLTVENGVVKTSLTKKEVERLK